MSDIYMKAIERDAKKAIEITAPFEGDANVFRMYLDVCEAAGIEKPVLKTGHSFHDHGWQFNNEVRFNAIDSDGDSYSIKIDDYSRDCDVADLKSVLSAKDPIKDVYCVSTKGRCKGTDNGYEFFSFAKESAVDKIHVLAYRNPDKADAKVQMDLHTTRPNHYKKELEALEEKLKEKLKIYGANVKLL